MTGNGQPETRAPGAARSALWAILLLRDVPFWNRSRNRRVARLVIFSAYVYLGVLLMLLALENRFLFPASSAADLWDDPPSGLTVEDVELRSTDGTRLHAWWAAPPGWTPDKGALLFCHGNGGNLSIRGEILPVWHRHLGAAVLVFDYPGYGKSAGQPSEASCYLAGDAAYDWLVRVKKVPQEEVIFFGESLGGAIATDLASRLPGRALVLLATFTSFPDMAQKTFPWLPGRWLVTNRLDNLTKIRQVKMPVFIAHGNKDQLIPFSQGERLFAAAPEPKRFFTILGYGHGGASEDFYAACGDFVRQHPIRLEK